MNNKTKNKIAICNNQGCEFDAFTQVIYFVILFIM